MNNKVVRVQMHIDELIELINNSPKLSEKLKIRYEVKIKRLEDKKQKTITSQNIKALRRKMKETIRKEKLEMKERVKELKKQNKKMEAKREKDEYKIFKKEIKEKTKSDINRMKGDAKAEKRRLQGIAKKQLKKEARQDFRGNLLLFVFNTIEKVKTFFKDFKVNTAE